MSHPKPRSSVVPLMAAALSVEDRPAPHRKAPTISHHSGYQLSIGHYNSRTEMLTPGGEKPTARAPLYTAEERRRRDSSPWTIVQAALAPIQFGIFLVSLCLVLRYLATGEGLALATISVVVKTIALYAIMITGSIWEREVFGRYLFARAFFWEDVFSILVLALHTLYLAALASGAFSPRNLMLVALTAYATYVINATQFLLKLRAARRQQPAVNAGAMGLAS
jgi:3-vinyl bacteriochlorophyllide hydratase